MSARKGKEHENKKRKVLLAGGNPWNAGGVRGRRE
jgi:hypothetical protein